MQEKQTNEIFALKVLRKDNIIRRNQVEHTKTERSVLGYVQHPFIVGMNMAFQSKDKLYFVLDYCAGGELFAELGRIGTFPVKRAGFYAAEIRRITGRPVYSIVSFLNWFQAGLNPPRFGKHGL